MNIYQEFEMIMSGDRSCDLENAKLLLLTAERGESMVDKKGFVAEMEAKPALFNEPFLVHCYEVFKGEIAICEAFAAYIKGRENENQPESMSLFGLTSTVA